MKCLYCNKDFEPLRNTAKFCSDACRRDFNRGVEKTSSKKIPDPKTKLDTPSLDVLPPKKDWWSAFVPYEPIMDEYQPLNGDVYCEHWGLLKGAYPKGKGTDLLARSYVTHLQDHQDTCSPLSKGRKYK